MPAPPAGKLIKFVTGNQGKLREVQGFLSNCPSLRFEAVSLDLTEVQDATPELISLRKSEEAYRLVNNIPQGQTRRTDGQPEVPVMVEDTSLCFNALGGLPGPYIKWFFESIGCEGLTRMLDGFESRGPQYRTAKALCIFSYCYGLDAEGKGQVEQFVGECPGHITPSPQGKNNFGWDAIFAPNDDPQRRTSGTRTFAEMQMDEKIEISHRTAALRKLRDYFTASSRKRGREEEDPALPSAAKKK